MTTNLADRVEGLDGPCRETDRMCARAFGWFRVEPRFAATRHGGWIAPEDFIGADPDGRPRLDSLHGTTIYRDPPAFTSSIDAVVALIGRELPAARLEVVTGNDYSSARIVTGWGAARKRVLAAPVERPDNHAAICAVAAFLRAKGGEHGE